MNKTTIFFMLFFTAAFSFSLSFAESQAPDIVVATQEDPYYFSDGGFGIAILKYYGIPLTPYLTPETTEESSLQDILSSYDKANEKTVLKTVVDDKDRAKYYVVHFWDTANGSKTFSTFAKFQPILIKNPLTPIGSQKYSTGFSLESLPNKNNQWFYTSIIKDFINPTRSPQPFGADIDLVTDDGTILETYQYKKCQVGGYVPFLSEILLRLQFTKQYKSEIRDRTDFVCDGFKVNFDLRKPLPDWTSIQSTIDYVPDSKFLAQRYVVNISSDIFKSGQTYYTFAKFTPMGVQDDVPLSIATNPVSGKSKSFSLESLPSKDKQQLYRYVMDKLSNRRQVQPVDISVDMIIGDGTILQTWKYSRCDVTNYSIYRQEISATWKFKQSPGAEIRDKTFLTCGGLQVNFIPHNIILTQNQTHDQAIPEDASRAQVFTIHFSGGNLKNSFNYTFLKFAPYSNFKLTPGSKEYSFNLPDYSFGNTPRFYVESIPSRDKSDVYKLISNYVNPATSPQQFDALVDLISGDGSVVETWVYAKCDITKYMPYFQNILQVNMFTEKFEPEIRDRIFFKCAGLSFKDGKYTINSRNASIIQPIKFVPNVNDRAQVFVVKFSNGDIRITHPFYTFADFQPDLSASDKVKTSYPQIKSTSFALSSLPSTDKADYYKFLSYYVNPTRKPEPFDTIIEAVTLDGTVVETWQYQKCNIINYQTFLQNNLIFYTLSGKKAVSEVQDKTTFQCSGFSINFDQYKEDLSQSNIPSDYSRVMTYVTHITSEVFPETRSSGLVQKFDTLGNQQFLLESLPNKYSKGGYQIVSKYINPGSKPELFDVNVDLITGDGTRLYSIKYPKCSGSDYSIHLDDDIVNIKFGTPIKSEIRDKSIVQCSGVNALLLSNDSPTNIIGPIIQKAIGISDNQIACSPGFQLMVRPPHENVICVKIDHVYNLTQRGWHTLTTSHTLSNLIKPIIPTVVERAMKIRTTFQGTEISTQTINTFSNFVPISKTSFIDPSHSLSDNTTPLFYLESLPSKDKSDIYHLVSLYVNPGVKPNPFDVKVEILNGDNSTLQTWNFSKCQITNYVSYLDENAMTYKFHLKWQTEIKDRTTFSCSGFNLGLG